MNCGEEKRSGIAQCVDHGVDFGAQPALAAPAISVSDEAAETANGLASAKVELGAR